MKKIILHYLLTLLMVLTTMVLICPQQVMSNSHTEEPVIRDSVNLVTIYTSVNNANGQFINGLKAGDFEIFDNSMREQIEYFTEEEAPISLVILFDISSSMQEPLEESRKALQQFLSSRQKQDEFCLFTFSSRVQLAADFTTNTEEIINALALISPNGLTAFNDAVYAGIEKIKEAHHNKRALLVISDGQDNRSIRRNDEINSLLREVDIQFYAISIPKEKKDRLQVWLMKEGQDTLKKLASISGGKTFFPNNISELGTVANTINNELRHQYSIGFTPNGSLDGRWHKLKVKIKGDIYNQFVIRSRAGYIARIR